MSEFLSYKALARLWIDKVTQVAPRSARQNHPDAFFLQGDLKNDLGLDSLEILELAACFHGMFQLLSGPVSRYLLQYQRAEEWLAALREGANDWEQPITFYTSGTTGAPKACVHDKHALLQEVAAWSEILPPANILWLCVSPQHIYGFLFGILLPDQGNVRVADGKGERFGEMVRQARPGDWLIGMPDLYAAWLQAQVPFASGLLAISSTAPLAPATAHGLAERNLKPVEIYGSSETGGIGYRCFPQDHFTLLPFWEKRGNQLQRLPTDQGSVAVCMPMDHLQWADERTFVITGRKDGVVQVGGHNVHPGQIATRMAEIEGVKACWVQKMSSKAGNRLKCWIIPDLPESEWNILEIRCYQWIETHLTVPERPRQLTLAPHPPEHADSWAEGRKQAYSTIKSS